MDTRTHELLRISQGLFSKRTSRLEYYQEVAENMYPQRADFTQTLELGQDYASLIYDSTPVLARETLGNGIDSMLRQGDWFKVGTGDKDRDARVANARALDIATFALKALIKDPRARWQTATKEADMDWVAFGNSVISVEENATRDFLNFRAWHLRDCAWMLSETGGVDALHRKFKMQARLLKRMKDSGRWANGEPLHQNILQAAEKDPTKEFECVHILMPAEELYADDGGKLRQIRHRFISCYIDTENETYLNEMGSPVFNYVVPRWRTLSGDPAGWSPAADIALPDGRMLQAISRTVQEQAEKAVDPPTIGDGQIFSRDLNFMAGGHTTVDIPDGRSLKDVFSVLQTSEGIRVGVDLKTDVRQLIAEAFLLNKLFLPDLREMTALETSVRTEEFRRAALPFFTPIESEYHSPVLGVAFEMAINMGLIPAQIFPAELQGQDIRFTFNSPLNEAEGRKTVDAYFATLQIASAAAEIDKTVATIFDFRKAASMAAKALPGAEPDWQLSEEKVKEDDKQAEMVRKLAQGAQIAREGAGVVADMSNATLAAKQAGMVPA